MSGQAQMVITSMALRYNQNMKNLIKITIISAMLTSVAYAEKLHQLPFPREWISLPGVDQYWSRQNNMLLLHEEENGQYVFYYQDLDGIQYDQASKQISLPYIVKNYYTNREVYRTTRIIDCKNMMVTMLRWSYSGVNTVWEKWTDNPRVDPLPTTCGYAFGSGNHQAESQSTKKHKKHH